MSDPTFSALLEQDTEAVQAYKNLQAMLKLARHQIFLEARLNKQETQMLDYGRRLDQIEATLGDDERHINVEQQSQIMQAVKAIAMQLSKRSGRNEYGGVYGELYRRFDIASYKQLPARKFQEAIDFLTEWHQSLVDNLAF